MQTISVTDLMVIDASRSMQSCSLSNIAARVQANFSGRAAMQKIVSSVKRMTTIMAEITPASQEQTASINQINQAISPMDRITRQNVALLVEETVAASKTMQDKAAKQANRSSVFKRNGMPSEVTTTTPIVLLTLCRSPRNKKFYLGRRR